MIVFADGEASVAFNGALGKPAEMSARPLEGLTTVLPMPNHEQPEPPVNAEPALSVTAVGLGSENWADCPTCVASPVREASAPLTCPDTEDPLD